MIMPRTETRIGRELEERLTRFLLALVNQEAAYVVAPPYEDAPGFWFGGGNLVRDADGALWLVGRYRNAGDSRTGTAMGTRGLELALFKSKDGGITFEKAAKWSKEDLSYPDQPVLSIEGCSLLLREGRAELYVSTEKIAPYPEEVAAFQKPGTGVWSIDVFHGASPESLDVSDLRPALDETPDPVHLHVKDPVVYAEEDGAATLIFCDHPFTWASVNAGYATRGPGEEAFTLRSWEMVSRGPAWDIAGTRITSRLQILRVGAFAELAPLSVYFYDGLECYREHPQNAAGVNRPRGHSCDEIAGAFYGHDGDFPALTRLSLLQPLFVSPHGTGCCRYIETLATAEGIHAIWQQSQPSGAQPLVGHFLPMAAVEALLA